MKILPSCRIRSGLLFVLAFAASTPGHAAPQPEISNYCYTNLQGLGICEPILGSCPVKYTSCDASNPCPDGTVCTVGTGCPSSHVGICLTPLADGGCSNPGTAAGGYAACNPVLFHEDFGTSIVGPEGVPVELDKLTVSNVCGTGAAMYKENFCAGTVGASSPVWTAHWGAYPASCASYSLANHREKATTGVVDISGCTGAELDFDYFLSLQETGQYDRAFLTVAVNGGFPELFATNQSGSGQAFTSSQNSCGGTILPVGNLIQDGAWHHYRAGIGSGKGVEVVFWGETADGVANSGQGWLFDDVRIDCGTRIFADGFEGDNFLRWSFTTAPPLLVAVDDPGSCPLGVPNFLACGGPDSSCYNLQTAEGPAYCLTSSVCGTSCTGSIDCSFGELCIVNTCCSSATPLASDRLVLPVGVCVPASCDPDAPIFVGPTRATGSSGG